MTKPIRVLIVDDSAFMRKTLSSLLGEKSGVTVVGTARNGEEGIQKAQELDPDVVTLDVEMPGMNGLEALKRIMATNPLPVLMVSSLTMDGAKETLTALELGAVDFICKQLEGVVTNIVGIQQELVSKVHAAAKRKGHVRPVTLPIAIKTGVTPRFSLSSQAMCATRGKKLIAIGCSTGGPQALMEVLPHFPEDIAAGIIIVQHMPKFFTKPFADRIDKFCRIDVREAQDGEVVRPGLALLAPGGSHLRVVRRNATNNEIRLSSNQEGYSHVPSVDVMMMSVASMYAERAVGVLLTGMGHDGLEGIRAIKGANGRSLAQNEDTCIVYGMPKAVVEEHLADKVLPLAHVSGEIMNMI